VIECNQSKGGMMNKELTENQKTAFVWWNNLSINEMKHFSKQYSPGFSYIELSKMSPDWIENIYNKESKTASK
jgi:hypothetical protein